MWALVLLSCFLWILEHLESVINLRRPRTLAIFALIYVIGLALVLSLWPTVVVAAPAREILIKNPQSAGIFYLTAVKHPYVEPQSLYQHFFDRVRPDPDDPGPFRYAKDTLESQTTAELVANILVMPDPNGVMVTSDGAGLERGDFITHINSHRILTGSNFQNYSSSPENLTVIRRAKPLTLTFDTPPDTGMLPLHHQELTLDNGYPSMNGSSAGLMFTLSYINALTSTDLTGGQHIAGTGVIHLDGSVSEILGVHQKMIAARTVGATIFFVPRGNYAEARADVPSGLELVAVDSVDDALDYLEP